MLRMTNWFDDFLDWIDNSKEWVLAHKLLLFRIFSIAILGVSLGIFIAILVIQVTYRNHIQVTMKNKDNQTEGEFTFTFPQWIYAWQGNDQVDVRFISDNSLEEPVSYKVNLIEEQPELVKLTDAKILEVNITPPGRFDDRMEFTSRGIPNNTNKVTFRVEIWPEDKTNLIVKTFAVDVNHYSQKLPIIAIAISLLSTLLSTVGNKFLGKAIRIFLGEE